MNVISKKDEYMKEDQLVFESLSYRRHTGADLKTIKAYVEFRARKRPAPEYYHACLRRLEKEGLIFKTGDRWFLTTIGFKTARGPAQRPGWEPGDAWILLAILYNTNESGCSLESIISTADYINHAIPTIAEIHGSINRLAAGRLITFKRGAFSATDQARELFAKVEAGCGRRVLDQLSGLGRILECPSCGVRLDRVAWKYSLTEDEYDKACSSYTGRFKR